MSKDIDIQDTRDYVYERDNYRCQHPGCMVCGYDNLVMAHLIAKSKANMKYVISFYFDCHKELLTFKEAMAILNHPLNLVASCAKHNSYFNMGNQPVKRDELLLEIFKEKILTK